ncbi:pilus assembly protein TadB [Massilia sp. WF1]|uniref:type II secretion system F family protein n=1 Tax=unclassified Massilia TaxID=2609279 RepID=UPI00064A79F8|nr:MULTISPECIES: type II secretion system F family protein [unclassified Massilia]ALK97857.1 pilus assembly protein TadB [Massilia sp. WG5]KLU35797.1 pilus assembly protein TadB [Massilia sp. WF1]
MDYLYFVFATLIFLAVVLLIEGAYMAWHATRGAEAQRLTQRMRTMSASDTAKPVSITKKRVMSTHPLVQDMLTALPFTAALDRLLAQSGKNWTVAGLLGCSLGAGLAAWAAAYWWAWPARLALSLGLALLPLQLVLRARAKRLDRIENQLADALELISRALRAGHAFPTALKMVGDEMKDPIAGEFGIVFDEINFGISMSDALGNLVNRVPSTDLRYFVVALMIQRETGGNLSELLDNIGRIIRDRIKLLGQVRVLSAEGKMSAWVLGLLPFGAAGMIQLTNPQFLALLLTDSAGQKMVGFALGMMAVGFFVMRKIIRIRV